MCLIYKSDENDRPLEYIDEASKCDIVDYAWHKKYQIIQENLKMKKGMMMPEMSCKSSERREVIDKREKAHKVDICGKLDFNILLVFTLII